MCTSRLKHTDKYSDNKTTFLLKKNSRLLMLQNKIDADYC